MHTIHTRLRKYRSQKGLTIQEVSKQTGIPASTYKEWENGRQIRGEPYILLADIYQVSLQELLTGQESQVNPVLKRLDQITAEIQLIKSDLITRF